MLFNSYQFIFLFLPFSYVIFLVLRKWEKLPLLWLTALSILFYALWNIESLPILGISILINFLLSRIIYKKPHRFNLVAFIAIIFNLLLLAYFKYTNFFIDNLNFLLNLNTINELPHASIALPLGISFFTFTQIAYILECKSNLSNKPSWIEYIFFVTFFPHLLAGPIIKNSQICPQLRDGFNQASIYHLCSGLAIFSIGLSKKILLADPFGSYADILFQQSTQNVVPETAIAYLGSISYTFQLYFDFSGYSDMAIGTALIFGIKLPINFNSPLKANSIIKFWQTWHISLTDFFRAYLFTPVSLYAMRTGLALTPTLNFFITKVCPTIIIFALIGFWHGPNWTFILFGILHGLFYLVNLEWQNFHKKYIPNIITKNILSKLLAWILTFIAVNLSFIMFRSENIQQAINIYKSLIFTNGIVESFRLVDTAIPIFINQLPINIFVYIILGFFLIFIPINTSQLINAFNNRTLNKFQIATIASYSAILIFISITRLTTTSPFLYVQF